MRDLDKFSAVEWLELLPLQHAFKQLRDDTLQAHYIRQRPPQLENFLQDNAHLRGKNVLQIVAFESPWALDWLLRMAARNLVDATPLVFDNSKRPEARKEIERVCRERGVAYLGLPPNRTRHVNRSHGRAMSWIFHNVINPLKPRSCGYIDHDLIPMEPVSMETLLGDQLVYGLLTPSPGGWSMWAGYSMFRFAALENRPLNFLHDFSRGFDTGGRNWKPLYSQINREGYRFGVASYVELMSPGEGKPRTIEVMDNHWFHLQGISYNDSFRPRADFFARIAKAIDEGVSWQQIKQNRDMLC